MDPLAERIFPTPPPRDGNIVRTGFVGGWEAQLRGTGRMTAFTTDHLLRFSAALDDVGLALVFMQRHRLELGLKLLLERADATEKAIKAGHDLAKLDSACGEALGGGPRADEWRRFGEKHGSLIALIDEVDRGSDVFRYPVGRDRRPLRRPALIDLAELERGTAAFHDSVLELVDLLARDEGLEIPSAENHLAIVELQAAIRAILTSRVLIETMDRAMSGLSGELPFGPRQRPDPKTAEILSSREEHFAIADALLVPLRRSLELIGGGQAEEIEPAALPSPPRGSVGHPLAVKERLEEHMDWVAQISGGTVGELGRALSAVYHRSEHWPGIASRQLHEDLGGFLTRIHPALVEHATGQEA